MIPTNYWFPKIYRKSLLLHKYILKHMPCRFAVNFGTLSILYSFHFRPWISPFYYPKRNREQIRQYRVAKTLVSSKPLGIYIYISLTDFVDIYDVGHLILSNIHNDIRVETKKKLYIVLAKCVNNNSECHKLFQSPRVQSDASNLPSQLPGFI